MKKAILIILFLCNCCIALFGNDVYFEYPDTISKTNIAATNVAARILQAIKILRNDLIKIDHSVYIHSFSMTNYSNDIDSIFMILTVEEAEPSRMLEIEYRINEEFKKIAEIQSWRLVVQPEPVTIFYEKIFERLNGEFKPLVK